MRALQTWRWVSATLLLAIGGVSTSWADGLAIQSFDETGRLTFNEISTALTYRVEWAPLPSGPWTNTWAKLNNIAQFATGSYTLPVPMFYRVVASLPSASQSGEGYFVVDLLGGSQASSYPVTYLADVPPGGWSNDYKTTKLVMRRIPAGTFTMGSPSGELGRYNNEVQHQVTLTRDFYMGVFEVTQRQWELVMGNKPSYFKNATYYQTRPVEQVSYYEIRENPLPVINGLFQHKGSAIKPNWRESGQVHADSFMGKLRTKTGLAGFDLPTESQWEYACRAGTTTALNSGYNLTNAGRDTRMDKVGRYSENHIGGYSYDSNVSTNKGTAAVGAYLPNAWGLYDMHGNVQEWCLDWFGTYPGAVSDPLGDTAVGVRRVSRGGSCSSPAGDCRSGFRNLYNFTPDEVNSGIGFRAVLSPSQQ